MSERDGDAVLIDRLREHLARVAADPAPPGLERRVLEFTARRGPSQRRLRLRTAVAALLSAAALTVALGFSLLWRQGDVPSFVGGAGPLSSSAAPSATAGATPLTPTPAADTVTPDEIMAVARRVFPQAQGGLAGSVTTCAGDAPSRDGSRPACPYTARLRDALRVFSDREHAEPWERAQFPGTLSSVTPEVTASGATAHVVLSAGPGYTPNRIDLVMIEQGGRLLIDDTQCTGAGAPSSIYGSAPPPCYALAP